MNGEEFLMQSIWQMLTALILLSVAAIVIPYLISKLLSRSKEKICKCGQRVSSSAKFCPNCGRDVKKLFANEKGGVSGRVLWLIVLLILLVFLILFFYLVGWNFLQDLMKKIIFK